MTEQKTIHNKKIYHILFTLTVFISLFLFLPETFDHSSRLIIAIISFGIALWVLEPIPLGLTALIILLLMIIFNVSEWEMIFSGFASPAIYLVVGGMMIARAVNETPLTKRIAYTILYKFGGTAKGLLGSVMIIPQVQAFFIPATAVRTTLLLPITTMLLHVVDAKPDSQLRKLILLGVAYGGNISGTGIMTAAIGNILTVELIEKYAGIKITFLDWLLYTFPLWLLLIPSIWLLLVKMFPLEEKEQKFPHLKTEMEEKRKELGPIRQEEMKCIAILVIIIGLWLTEPLHHLHPAIPALIGAVLLTLPGIGCSSWEKIVNINYDTILLLSVTLSMGYVFIDTGAADVLATYLSMGWVLSILQSPFLGILFIVILTQIFHKLISNVGTAVVTIIPIVLSLSASANVDPFLLSFTAGLTSLYGFMLVVETMPNLLVHGTGMIDQKAFLKPGFYATLITILCTLIVALTWWKWIGLLA